MAEFLKYETNLRALHIHVEPDAPQGAALYDRRG